MTIEIYILKPGLTSPGAVEAGSWVTSPSEVTHFLMECDVMGDQVTNELIENVYSGPKNNIINIKKIPRIKVFTNIYLQDIADTYKWKQALDYALLEWPSVTGKYSPIYRKTVGGSEFTGDYIWNGSALARWQGTIFTYQAEETSPNEVIIKTISMKWGSN